MPRNQRFIAAFCLHRVSGEMVSEMKNVLEVVTAFKSTQYLIRLSTLHFVIQEAHKKLVFFGSFF